MSRRRRDDRTLDLLDWQGVVRRYEDHRVRAATLRVKVARAVAETLRDCGTERTEVARLMSEYLGERVSKHMLDGYASEAREEHSISFVRLAALVQVTGDPRPLQVAAELIGHSVIADRFLEWVRLGEKAERREHIRKEAEESDRDFDLQLRVVRRSARP